MIYISFLHIYIYIYIYWTISRCILIFFVVCFFHWLYEFIPIRFKYILFALSCIKYSYFVNIKHYFNNNFWKYINIQNSIFSSVHNYSTTHFSTFQNVYVYWIMLFYSLFGEFFWGQNQLELFLRMRRFFRSFIDWSRRRS